jgi:hypothetical protein
MPTYDFVNNETGEEFESFMSIAAREQYLKDNPHIQQLLGATATVGGVSITGKIPDGFKDVLSKVAENHSASAVGQQYGRQSISAIKTKELVKKHIG